MTIPSIIAGRKGSLYKLEDYKENYYDHLPKILEKSRAEFDNEKIFSPAWLEKYDLIENYHQKVEGSVDRIFEYHQVKLIQEVAQFLRKEDNSVLKRITNLKKSEGFHFYKLEETKNELDFLNSSQKRKTLEIYEKHFEKAKTEAARFIEIFNRICQEKTSDPKFSLYQLYGDTKGRLFGCKDKLFLGGSNGMRGIETSSTPSVWEAFIKNAQVEAKSILQLLNPKEISRELKYLKETRYKQLENEFEMTHEKVDNPFKFIHRFFHVFNNSVLGSLLFVGILFSRLFSVLCYLISAKRKGVDQFANSQYLSDDKRKKREFFHQLARGSFSLSQGLNIPSSMFISNEPFGILLGSLSGAANLSSSILSTIHLESPFLSRVECSLFAFGGITAGLTTISRDIYELIETINHTKV